MRVVTVMKFFVNATLPSPHPPYGHLLPEGRRELRLGSKRWGYLRSGDPLTIDGKFSIIMY
jgi:hypothetical protein